MADKNKAAVSKDDIEHAAMAILNETNLAPSKITIVMVRDRLGGRGSQPTISKYLRAWKEAMKTESDMPASVTTASNDFVSQIWASAKAEAEKEYHDERRDLVAQTEELQTILEGTEAHVKSLLADLTVASASADRAQNEADRLTEEANRLTADLTDAVKAKEEFAGANLTLEKRVAVLEAQLAAKDEQHAKEIALLERLLSDTNRRNQSFPAEEKALRKT